MNTLDIILTVITAFLVVWGLWKGLISTIASLGGFILGFYLANEYSHQVTPYVNKVVADPSWSSIVAYALVFIATLVGVVIIAGILKKILNLAFASWLDHLAGGLLGLLQAVIIGCLIVFLLNIFFTGEGFMRESKIVPYLENITTRIEEFIPQLRDLREDERFNPGLPNAPGQNPAPGENSSS